MSRGYAFVEYESADAARAGRDTLNDYQLDKAHKFVTSLFDDFERLGRVPEQWREPEARPYEGPPNLQVEGGGLGVLAVCWAGARRRRRRMEGPMRIAQAAGGGARGQRGMCFGGQGWLAGFKHSGAARPSCVAASGGTHGWHVRPQESTGNFGAGKREGVGLVCPLHHIF